MSLTGRKTWRLCAFIIGAVMAFTLMKGWPQASAQSASQDTVQDRLKKIEAEVFGVKDNPDTKDEDETKAGVSEMAETLTLGTDNFWTLIAAFLVMWMQAGFALVEAGLTRAKNSVNICMKNLLDFGFGTVSFWLVGFAFMFGTGSDFIGTSGFALADNGKDTFASLAWSSTTIETKFLFQLVFAATAATIVSGAMAERTKFGSYMVYSIFISAIIYPVSGHWIWGGGWLGNMGFLDFAGSTVVHSVGAWLALCGAFILGPRIGKYDESGKARAIPGHNMPLVLLGTFILWLGWFGFNPGSTMGMGNGADLAHVAVTTNMAAAVGSIAAIFTSKIWFGKWDGSMACNGALAGLVAITCPCYWVTPFGAVIIGLVAGVLVVASVVFIDQKLKIDDPVGAISVHGVCGAWGTISLGLFGATEGAAATDAPMGLLYGGTFKQLGLQLVGVGAVFGWCIVTGLALFIGIKAVMGLRVSKEEELSGLDVGEHGMESYPGFQSVEPKS